MSLIIDIDKEMVNNYRVWKIDLVTGKSNENVSYDVMDYIVRHHISLKKLDSLLETCDFLTINAITGSVSEWDQDDMDEFDSFLNDF